MGKDRSQQSFRDSPLAKLRNHEYVGEVSKHCAVRDDAGECDLLVGGVGAKTQRVSDRTLDGCAPQPNRKCAETRGPARRQFGPGRMKSPNPTEALALQKARDNTREVLPMSPD